MRFIKIKENQISEIIDLAKKIWLPTFAIIIEEPRLSALFHGMYNPEKLQSDLSNDDYQYYFIQVKDDLIGYYAIMCYEKEIKLDKIYIDLNLQRTGLGSKVLLHIEKEAMEMGKEKITLRVNRKNEKAIRFYKKHLFTISESIDIPGPDGFIYDDYIMVKQL